ncbi:MAG: hypothetical protein A2297_04480 [Elusimicrobia bacterium RIFOXYB2_FULL_48_7]|nr:MAG: hypothetical protein A2297_04480 [Elusimicrobia bacterium RIFOXYB2_FULL_48_7]
MTITNELEHYRLEHQLTYAKLAKILGVHLVTVQKWVGGNIKPSKIHEYQIKKLIEGGILPKNTPAGKDESLISKADESFQDNIRKQMNETGHYVVISKNHEEADKKGVLINKLIPPEKRIEGTFQLRELFYESNNNKKEILDKTVIGTIRKEDLWKREIEDMKYFKGHSARQSK